MNKAFVRETEDDDEEDIDAPLQLPQGTRNYITPVGYARIKDELNHLLRTERPNIVEVVHWAASNGDRSENGDYLYGKKRLREIDRRIRFLTKRLDLAEVVGVDETDFSRNRISWVSPLARALLKAREGDQVRFQSPLGWREVDVERVEYKAIEP